MVALPLGLYAAITERQSWKPRVLPAPYKGGSVGSMLWSEDSKTLFVSYEDKLCLWDTTQKSLRRSLKTGSPIYGMQWSPTGLLGCAATGRETCYLSVDVWDIQKNKRVLAPNLRPPFAFSDDGRYVIAGSDADKTIEFTVLDVRSARVQKKVRMTIPKNLHLVAARGVGSGGTCGGIDPVNFVLSRTGKWGAVSLYRESKKAVYSGHWWYPSEPGALLLFDVQTGKHLWSVPISRLPGPSMPTLLFAPDEKNIVVMGGKGLQFWDVQTGQLKWRVKDNSIYFNEPIELSPDGFFLAYKRIDDENLIIRDLKSGRMERQIKTRDVAALAFSPDSSTLVTGHINGTVKLWRLR